METSYWKPTKSENAAINRGVRKETWHRYKANHFMKIVTCKYCSRDIYLELTRHGSKMFTMKGSEHACINSPRGKKSTGEER